MSGPPNRSRSRSARRSTWTKDEHTEIRGRDLVSGLPKTVVISAAEVRKAIEEPVNAIVDAVKTTLDKCPPELSGDVMDRGIVLTGGGALLRGLDERLRRETGHADPHRRGPAGLRGARLRQVRRGVRGAPAGAGRPAPAVATCDAPSAVVRPPSDRYGPRGRTVDYHRRTNIPTRKARPPHVRDTRESRLLLVLLIAIAFALITVDIRGGEESPVDGARQAAATVFGPVENGVAAAVDPVGNAIGAVRDSGDRHDRIAALEQRERRAKASSAATTATAAGSAELDKHAEDRRQPASTASRAPRSSP